MSESPTSAAELIQDSLVGAASNALGGALADAGPTLLPRVLGDSPVAVLLIDRSSGAVTYANTAALELAGDVTLPVPIDQWSAKAGVTDIDGAPLASSSEPLSRVASGDPVAGEPVRVRGTDAAAATDRGTDDDRGPVVWVTGFPLGTGDEGDSMSLLVFLPVEQPSGQADPEQVLQALRERAVLATDICFTISDPRQPENPLVWVNPAFTRITGYAVEDAVGRNCKFLQGPATDPAAVTQMVTDLSAGRSTAVTLLNYRPDGTAFWNHVAISPVRDGAGELVSFVGVQTDVTARVAADAQRDTALAAEQAARRAAERAQAAAEAARARLALMAEATTTLGASLDLTELQNRLARLCVPLLADWVTISQVDAAGVVTSLTSQHRDGESAREPLQAMAARYLGRRFPDSSPARLAMSTGRPVVLTGLTAADMQPYARGLTETPTLDELGTGSLMAIPLTGRSGTWGVFMLVRRNPDGFDDGDLRIAHDLGHRAGQAFDNARLYAREASVAETLQRALLPELPPIDTIQSAARYLPASAGAAVGGDFYDLISLPGGSTGIVIGDVTGHDIAAAAAMGQLRGLIRSEAWDDDAPHHVLHRVDHLISALRLPIMATAVLLRATPTHQTGTWTVECANAGHPPVLLRTPDGTVDELCHDHGVLLGTGLASELPPRTSTTHHMPAGSQLLLFTDGLIEQPAADRTGGTLDFDAGTQRLRDLWSALPRTADPATVCDAATDLISQRADDIAILVVQLADPTT